MKKRSADHFGSLESDRSAIKTERLSRDLRSLDGGGGPRCLLIPPLLPIGSENWVSTIYLSPVPYQSPPSSIYREKSVFPKEGIFTRS